MLIGSQLEYSFWAEARSTATFTLNLIPNEDGKSPNELWNGEKGGIERLRVFGCYALVHIPKEKRRKLDEKSVNLWDMSKTQWHIDYTMKKMD